MHSDQFSVKGSIVVIFHCPFCVRSGNREVEEKWQFWPRKLGSLPGCYLMPSLGLPSSKVRNFKKDLGIPEVWSACIQTSSTPRQGWRKGTTEEPHLTSLKRPQRPRRPQLEQLTNNNDMPLATLLQVGRELPAGKPRWRGKALLLRHCC